MYNFERFTKVGSTFKSRVSISKTGTISFSEGAKQQFGLTRENATNVELYYDKIARVIGLRFVAENTAENVKTHFRETGLDFAAKSFLDYYQILPQETSFYETEKETESGLIIIKIDKSTVRKRRKDRSDI